MSDSKSSGSYALNLLVLIAIGVGSLYWIGYHTEFLAIIGGLLGLGGIFAWVAFVAKLIHDDRKHELQESFDDWLSRRRTTVYCLIALALALVAGSLFSSIQFDARRDTVDRFVEIRKSEIEVAGHAYRAELVSGRTMLKMPVFVGFSGRDYAVHVDGLPNLEVRATRFTRKILLLPDDFLRKNVVLLRPETVFGQSLHNMETPPELIVRIDRNGKPPYEFVVPNYRGESVWIGCEQNVAIPDALQQAWKLELSAQNAPEVNILPWLTPISVAQDLTLSRGKIIEVEVNRPGKLLAKKTISVQQCAQASCFPQEQVLRISN